MPSIPPHTISFIAALLACVLFAGGCQSRSPEQLLRDARTAADAADFRTASIHLRTMLQRDPASVDALLLLADVALAVGDAPLAERNYRRAAELGADPGRYWFPWLEALLQLDRFPEVLERVGERPLTTAADQARQQLMIGQARIGQGRDQEAEVALRRALEIDPGLVVAHRDLARLYFRTGRGTEGEREIEAALATAPNDPEVLLLRGIRLLSAGDAEEAATVLSRALEGAPGQPPLQVRILNVLADAELVLGRIDAVAERERALTRLLGNEPEVRYVRARLALERQDVERARHELQEALATDRNFGPAQRLLGAMYTLENQFDLAEMYLRPVVASNPDDLYARRLLATVHLARGKPAEALPLLDNIVAKDEESRQALLTMKGQASLEIGDIARATRFFSEGSREFPDNPLFELGLSLTLLAEGRTAEAERILHQIRGAETESVRAAFLAIAAMQVGRTDDALASARAIVARNPEAAWAQGLLGSILMATGQFAEARVNLAKSVELNPTDAPAIANLARVEQLLGNGDAALEAWQRILARDPSNAEAAIGYAGLSLARGNVADALRTLTPFQNTSHQAQLLVSGILLDRGQSEAALRLASQVVKAEPENAEAHNLFGLAQLATGTPQSAQASFRRAAELRPTAAIYHFNLARAYLVAGDQKGATAALGVVRRLEPTLPQLHSLEVVSRIHAGDLEGASRALDGMVVSGAEGAALRDALRGELLAAERRFAEAADSYSAAYAARPSLELAIRIHGMRRAAGQPGRTELLADWVRRNQEDPRALLVLADAYFADGEPNKAIAHYERLIGLIPDDLNALNNLAWLYQEREDPRAIRLADRASQLAPDNAAILDTAGWSHFRLGNRQRGMELLRRAASLAPDDPDIQYHLAAGLIGTGQADEGKRLLAKIVESGSEFASRSDAERLLGRM